MEKNTNNIHQSAAAGGSKGGAGKNGRIADKKELLGAAGIFLAALLWGVSYPATKIVEDQPTFFILPVRFLVAAAVLAVVFHRNLARINLKVIKQAFMLSFFITGMYVFSTIGIKYTISARASFFTCLTFVFVPIINRMGMPLRIHFSGDVKAKPIIANLLAKTVCKQYTGPENAGCVGFGERQKKIPACRVADGD